MKVLPASPDLSHLKKQAKNLLRDARAGEVAALQRFIEALPAARGATVAALATRDLALHDAQSVVAREYGFASWVELRRHVEWTHAGAAERRKSWFDLVYDGGVRARRRAMRLLEEEPELFRGDPWVACAVGDVGTLRTVIAAEAGWANRAGGPRQMPPLIAVTHSRMMAEEGLEERLVSSAELLLESGADVNLRFTVPRYPEWSLSALYGAAGVTHSARMTELLLAAGANPDDNESLYHSVEGADSTCTRLLLRAGARVDGTNSLGRVLDFDKLDDLRLMLEHGGDANEKPWVHHAIERGRSLAHVQALVDAGADLRKTNDHGVSVYRFAQALGRTDVVELLREAGVEESLSGTDAFVAACARGDASAARAMLARTPDMIASLGEHQLRALPELAATGNIAGVRTMLEVGWPVDVKMGWNATALNHAAFRGDARIVDLVLDHGADWRVKHAYDDNVIGTLSFASQMETMDTIASRDYVGCARALLAHGVPVPNPEAYSFSDELTAFFDAKRLRT